MDDEIELPFERHYYAAKAARLREMAENATAYTVRDYLLETAVKFDRLAERAAATGAYRGLVLRNDVPALFLQGRNQPVPGRANQKLVGVKHAGWFAPGRVLTRQVRTDGIERIAGREFAEEHVAAHLGRHTRARGSRSLPKAAL